MALTVSSLEQSKLLYEVLLGTLYSPYGQFIQPRVKLFENLVLNSIDDIDSQPTGPYMLVS